MKRSGAAYVIGVDDHYAWANLVSIAISGNAEILLDRRRIALLDESLPASPYHHETLNMPAADAESLVRDVKASANRLASAALAALTHELAPAACLGLAIRVPPLPALPATVAAVHASASITNRADGMIYHRALTDAAAGLGWPVFHFDKDAVLGLAARDRGKPAPVFERQLKALGAAVGPPWRKEHIIACAGAILAGRSLAKKKR